MDQPGYPKTKICKFFFILLPKIFIFFVLFCFILRQKPVIFLYFTDQPGTNGKKNRIFFYSHPKAKVCKIFFCFHLKTEIFKNIYIQCYLDIEISNFFYLMDQPGTIYKKYQKNFYSNSKAVFYICLKKTLASLYFFRIQNNFSHTQLEFVSHLQEDFQGHRLQPQFCFLLFSSLERFLYCL